MKTLLTIPAHGQNVFLPKMLERLAGLTENPAECRYIIDRPEPGEYEEALRIYGEFSDKYDLRFANLTRSDGCPEWVGHPQMNYGAEYFLTGYVRNQSIEYALRNGFDAMVFIDGDCVPEPDLIKAHNELLSAETPVATVGRRREVIWDMEDQRMKSPASICAFFSEMPNRITNEFWFVDSGVVWTCNFGLNRKALERLLYINKTLYGRAEVFCSEFSGTWGGEDGFIGMECLYGGVPVYSLPNGENGIIHQPHTRPLSKYEHPSFLTFLESMREDLLLRMRMTGISDRRFVSRMRMSKS